MLSKTIQDAKMMQEAMKLKFTYRFGNRLEGPQESVAAHTWSMMLIADYLLVKLETLVPGKYNLDRVKIYQLITYHDLIEAETGDEDLDPGNAKNHDSKHEREEAAMKDFPSRLPKDLQDTFKKAYREYEDRGTLESKFVKIVDCIEAEYFCVDKRHLFIEWNRDFHESKRLHYYDDFPELLYIQKDLIDYADKNYY